MPGVAVGDKVDVQIQPSRAPKGSIEVSHTMRWPADTLACIKQEAERQGVSAAEWVRRACEAILPA